MKAHLALTLFLVGSLSTFSHAQTLYAPGGSVGNSSNSNVGIGTSSPVAKLDVVGGEVRLPGGANPGNWSTHFNFGGNGQNYIRGITIFGDDGSNVGIGTSSPAQRLHVAGTVRIDGAIVAPEGTLRDDNGGWVRTYGATGWYSQTYGGGWYMSDTSWIRTYGNKNIYQNAGTNKDVTS